MEVKQINIEKDKLRTYFQNIIDYLNISPLYQQVGIKQSNFSSFINKGVNKDVSYDKLIEIKKLCEEAINKLNQAEIDYKKEK